MSTRSLTTLTVFGRFIKNKAIVRGYQVKNVGYDPPLACPIISYNYSTMPTKSPIEDYPADTFMNEEDRQYYLKNRERIRLSKITRNEPKRTT
jgi:hypothetical protein